RRDPRPPRRPKARRRRPRLPDVRPQPDLVKFGMLRAQPLEHLGRPVGRAVVDDQDVEPSQAESPVLALAAKRSQSRDDLAEEPRQALSLVPGRDDDRQDRQSVARGWVVAPPRPGFVLPPALGEVGPLPWNRRHGEPPCSSEKPTRPLEPSP